MSWVDRLFFGVYIPGWFVCFGHAFTKYSHEGVTDWLAWWLAVAVSFFWPMYLSAQLWGLTA